MSEQNNATCCVCGKRYHVCKSCLEQKTFKPWRTVTDTVEHYKIYLAIHSYTVSKKKERAKSELKQCDLSELESFLPEIKAAILEIMAEPEKEKSVPKRGKENKKAEAKEQDMDE